MKVEAKFIAILDRRTYIPVICMRFREASTHEARMFARAGFGGEPGERYTFSYLPEGFDWCSYDPYRAPDEYTISTALVWIREHWDEIESGTAVDSEFIRGKKDTPKTWEDEFNYDCLGDL